jgi:hypothetical protein
MQGIACGLNATATLMTFHHRTNSSGGRPSRPAISWSERRLRKWRFSARSSISIVGRHTGGSALALFRSRIAASSARFLTSAARRRAMTFGDTVPGRKPPRFSRRGPLSAVSACVSAVVMLPSSQPTGGGSLKPAPVGLAARGWEHAPSVNTPNLTGPYQSHTAAPEQTAPHLTAGLHPTTPHQRTTVAHLFARAGPRGVAFPRAPALGSIDAFVAFTFALWASGRGRVIGPLLTVLAVRACHSLGFHGCFGVRRGSKFSLNAKVGVARAAQFDGAAAGRRPNPPAADSWCAHPS